MEKKNDYSDILPLSRPVSTRHRPMDRVARAAQFSAFAALSGYEDVIREEQRLTSLRPEPGEKETELLDQKLGVLADCQMAHPTVTATWFRPDREKAGGEAVTVTGALRDLNAAEGVLTFTSGETVPIADLLDLKSDLFAPLPDPLSTE